jgi:hypothetical protein
MTDGWHPVGAGGGVGMKGEPQARGGAERLKIAAAGFRLANVEAGGGGGAATANRAVLPLGRGVSHGGELMR